MRDRQRYTAQSPRCACEVLAPTPGRYELSGRKQARHGDPFTGRGGCVHSDLILTTRRHRFSVRSVRRVA